MYEELREMLEDRIDGYDYISAPALENKIQDAYDNGDISYDEYEELMQRLE